MLDECVSELNRRRKVQKDAEQHTHTVSRFTRTSTTKRIPSWNCLAHVGSWGSLDEDGIAERMQAGGPWGGPSLHKLKQRCDRHDGSDSDSGAENMEPGNLSWTRVGGPLMKSASALKFVFEQDNDEGSAECLHMIPVPVPSDGGHCGDMGSGFAITSPNKSSQVSTCAIRYLQVREKQ